MSTGIGFGIGIPHASTDLISEVVGAFGRRRRRQLRRARQPAGHARHALPRPQGQFQKHLHTLAKIAKLLHKKEFRQALEDAPDARRCSTSSSGSRGSNAAAKMQRQAGDPLDGAAEHG